LRAVCRGNLDIGPRIGRDLVVAGVRLVVDDLALFWGEVLDTSLD
jgi:hypothetical protein